MTTTSTEGFITSDGMEIYTKTWQPAADQKIKATVIFAHGLGDHINRYNHVFSKFAENGIKVHAFDQRGFGQTAKKNGIAGHNEGFKQVMKDMKDASERVRIDGVAHFVMGHSMGGCIALNFAIEHPENLAGCIGCAPLVITAPEAQVPAWKTFLVKRLAVHIHPRLAVPSELDSHSICRDPNVVKAHIEDPFVHPFITLRTATDIISHGEKLLKENYKRWTVPSLLIAHGTKDKLTSHVASKEFIDKVPITDKKYSEWEGMYHELHNEPEQSQVIAEYIDWITRHSA